jgi:Holliday junction resolvase RusA-like endonuclease
LYRFTWDGPIVPKARPRVTDNGTYMPHKYKDWKEAAVSEFRFQALEMRLPEPITSCQIAITLKGNHSRRGDLDNVSGSLLDALVKANILSNDNMTVIYALSIKLDWNKKQPPTAEILILP